MYKHIITPPPEVTWKVVQDHMPVIKRCVEAAIWRGYVAYQDRDSAISDATVTAYKLAERHDQRAPFENYLRATLSRNLLRDFTRKGTDALNHAEVDFKEAADTMPDDKTPDEKVFDVLSVALAKSDRTPAQSEIMSRIGQRIPPRIQQIAKMALVDGLSLTKIAHRTGRSQPGPKAELRKIIERCIRCVYGL